jgi:hypothetical protein
MKKLKIYFLLLTVTVLINACYYDKEQLLHPSTGDACAGVSNTFTKDVKPVIDASCANGAGCHGAGSTNGPGALTTYGQVKANATQILNSVSAGRMPIGSTLTAGQVKSLSCWIGNGSLNN